MSAFSLKSMTPFNWQVVLDSAMFYSSGCDREIENKTKGKVCLGFWIRFEKVDFDSSFKVDETKSQKKEKSQQEAFIGQGLA